MGNQQSNEPKREYKVYRIIIKEKHSQWIRYYLDGDVPYRNGNHNFIDFEQHSTGFVLLALSCDLMGGDTNFISSFDVGDFIKIDLEVSRRNNSGHNFSHNRDWLVGKVFWDRSEQNNIILTTGEWLQEIAEHRELRANAIQDYRAFQQASEWHLEPPRR